jgi:hypothetical protein
VVVIAQFKQFGIVFNIFQAFRPLSVLTIHKRKFQTFATDDTLKALAYRRLVDVVVFVDAVHFVVMIEQRRDDPPFETFQLEWRPKSHDEFNVLVVKFAILADGR